MDSAELNTVTCYHVEEKKFYNIAKDDFEGRIRNW